MLKSSLLIISRGSVGVRVGMKSLLLGVHQFAWNPITVWIAWYKLYGCPNFKETICIIIHDWGYWFCCDMDGIEGERHPEFGARLTGKLFGDEYYQIVLFHSRHYSKLVGKEPSKLVGQTRYRSSMIRSISISCVQLRMVRLRNIV